MNFVIFVVSFIKKPFYFRPKITMVELVMLCSKMVMMPLGEEVQWIYSISFLLTKFSNLKKKVHIFLCFFIYFFISTFP